MSGSSTQVVMWPSGNYMGQRASQGGSGMFHSSTVLRLRESVVSIYNCRSFLFKFLNYSKIFQVAINHILFILDSDVHVKNPQKYCGIFPFSFHGNTEL